jgi:hypothetical protein
MGKKSRRRRDEMISEFLDSICPGICFGNFSFRSGICLLSEVGSKCLEQKNKKKSVTKTNTAGKGTDENPQAEYVASIKISRKQNGKILGASVFIPAEFIEGLVDASDSVKLKISRHNNNIILTI